MTLGTLYICYFNTEEPLVHTQVLSYLRAVAGAGVRVHLLTYEKRGQWRAGESARRGELRERLAADGIHWHALRYHKRPSLLATAFDVTVGILYGAWLLLCHRLTVVHARAHIPGVMGLMLQSALGRKLIFDLRGQMAEEYVDNGVWTPQSPGFRLVKAAERLLLSRADRVVVLTENFRDRLLESAAVGAAKISVIPCCADLSQYAGAARKSKPTGPLTLVYTGSLGRRYLLGEMIEFFKVLRDKRPGSRFLLLTRSDHAQAERAFVERGVDGESYSIISVPPADVPMQLRDADVAINFIKQSEAVRAMSPTKLGEYLAAGLPVVSTPGGDTEKRLQPSRAGVVVGELTRPAFEAAAEQLLALLDDSKSDAPERCRDVARQYYSLAEVGGPRYVALYQSLAPEAADDVVDSDDDADEPNARCPICRTSASGVALNAREGVRLRRCPDCGLHYHAGFADPLEAQEYYSNYYHEENTAFSPLTEARFQSLVASFEPYRETGRLLDVGCGAGHFLKVANERGWSAHGTEIAASAFERLSRYGIKTFQGELQAAGYPADFFDVIYCSEVIEHLLDPLSLLQESARILRPGGLLYLTTPNFNSLSRRLLGARWRVICKEHVCYFTPKLLARRLGDLGFARVSRRTRNIDPHELRKLFGPAGVEPGGFQIDRTEALRDHIERNRALNIVKNMTNALLAVTASGDTIILRAEKSRGGGRRSR
jgi:2-polyprenyl-3-methyl-5-hydroxy-6-metoxy-1,4-benzoquinol methylase/glycosyltransferase involved in cell wall biosynthesis